MFSILVCWLSFCCCYYVFVVHEYLVTGREYGQTWYWACILFRNLLVNSLVCLVFFVPLLCIIKFRGLLSWWGVLHLMHVDFKVWGYLQGSWYKVQIVIMGSRGWLRKIISLKKEKNGNAKSPKVSLIMVLLPAPDMFFSISLCILYVRIWRHFGAWK